MTTADGTVAATTRILDNGPASRRYNVVLLSEGYQAGQLAQFANDAMAFVQQLGRTPPFHLVMNAINVFQVDVSSTDTGADLPAACGGPGTMAATYFDATFCGDMTNQRLLTVDQALAMQVASTAVPEQDLVVVVVNSAVYGGSGGGVAVYSLAAGALEIALHEIGHTAFKLADEYEYLQGCGSGETDRDNHPGVEPVARNVRCRAAGGGQLKWGRYVQSGIAVPTTSNPNCTACDRRQARSRPAGSEPSRGPTATTAARSVPSSTTGCARSGSPSAASAQPRSSPRCAPTRP